MKEQEDGGYKDVMLLDYCFTTTGQKIKQAVVMDGKIVSRYRKIEDWEFRANDKDASETKAAKAKISEAFQAVYDGRIGRVSHVSSARQRNGKGGPEFTVAVVSMDNVRKMTDAELKAARNQKYEPIESFVAEQRKNAPRKEGSLLSRISTASSKIVKQVAAPVTAEKVEVTEDILQDAAMLDSLL